VLLSRRRGSVSARRWLNLENAPTRWHYLAGARKDVSSMASHFRIIQEYGAYSVYSVNNPVEAEERFTTLEQAERYVNRNDRILGALDKIYDEINAWADRLATEYHTNRRQTVAWLTIAMMRVDE